MRENKIRAVTWRVLIGIYETVQEAKWYWPSLTTEEWTEVEKRVSENRVK